MGHDVDFYLIDCSTVLPNSGKTISDRFNLGIDKHEVTLFISGNTGLPVAIPPDYHKSTKDLIRFIKTKTTIYIHKIKTSRDLKSKCLNRNMCFLILKPKSVDDKFAKMMKRLLKKYKDVRFCIVESEHVLVSHVEEYIPLYDGKIRIVVFQRNNNKGKSVLSFSYLNKNVDYKNMDQLLKRVVQRNSIEWKKLPLIPYIQTRSKKNEKLDIKKRERLKKQEGKLFGESKIRNHPEYKDKIKEKKRRKRMMRQEENNIVESRDYVNIRNEDLIKVSDKVLEEYIEEDILDLD